MAEGMYCFEEVGVKSSHTNSVYERRIKTGIVKYPFLTSLGAGMPLQRGRAERGF